MDSNQPSKHINWQSIAIWALLALLTLVTFYTNKQFTDLSTAMNAVQTTVVALAKDNEKRLTALETRETLLLKIIESQCK